MKKALTLFVFAALLAANAVATYLVVMKDGTQYKAKAKWTVVNGKALIRLENGQTLQVDPSLIDVAKSEQMAKMGITDGSVLDLNTDLPLPAAKSQESLGDKIKLRKQPGNSPEAARTGAATSTPVAGGASVPAEVIDKFAKAFDNVGIYDVKVTSTGAASIRAEGTADSEDRVFLALSAASFLLVRNAGVPGIEMQSLELVLKQTTGGNSGHFNIQRAEAEALEKVPPAGRQAALQDYFVRHVIY